MSDIVFYRQQRVDGLSRTGVDVDNEPILMHLAGSSEGYDPAILWFVDVKIENVEMEASAGRVRSFLMDHSTDIQQALDQVAEKLALGLDSAVRPLQVAMEVPSNGRVVVACSAVDRLAGRKLAAEIQELGSRWGTIISTLPEYQGDE